MSANLNPNAQTFTPGGDRGRGGRRRGNRRGNTAHAYGRGGFTPVTFAAATSHPTYWTYPDWSGPSLGAGHVARVNEQVSPRTVPAGPPAMSEFERGAKQAEFAFVMRVNQIHSNTSAFLDLTVIASALHQDMLRDQQEQDLASGNWSTNAFTQGFVERANQMLHMGEVQLQAMYMAMMNSGSNVCYMDG